MSGQPPFAGEASDQKSLVSQEATMEHTTKHSHDDHGYGWKFLNPYGATERGGVETLYPLPRPAEKWGPWFTHSNPCAPDGDDCGPGRWHVMKRLDACYAPEDWWVWFAEYRGVIGESQEKVGVRELRLRRVSIRVFARLLRWGYGSGANLVRANLVGANLVRANLVRANLYSANLDGAINKDKAIGLKVE